MDLTKDFNGTQIKLVEYEADFWLSGEQIGNALEYTDPKKSIHKLFERNTTELKDYSTTVNLTAVDGKQRKTRVYNEEGVMLLTMLSKQPKAVEFRKWAIQVLKAYRHGELSQQPMKLLAPLSDIGPEPVECSATAFFRVALPEFLQLKEVKFKFEDVFKQYESWCGRNEYSKIDWWSFRRVLDGVQEICKDSRDPQGYLIFGTKEEITAIGFKELMDHEGIWGDE